MSKTYNNLIFTTHAYNRILSRSLALHSISEAINYPDTVYKEKQQSKKYIKTIQGRKYHVIATYKPDQKKYIVISAWVRGEEDKESLLWHILTTPFRLIWWMLQLLWRLAIGKKNK